MLGNTVLFSNAMKTPQNEKKPLKRGVYVHTLPGGGGPFDVLEWHSKRQGKSGSHKERHLSSPGL